MSLTGRLGTSDSRLGNFQLAAAGLGGGTVYFKDVSESLTLSQSATKTMSYGRNISETITFGETDSDSDTFNKNVSETLTLTLTLTETKSKFKPIAETLTLVELAQGRLPGIMFVNMPLLIEFFETVDRSVTYHRNISETLTIVETPFVRLPEIFNLTINEALIINQSAATNKTLQKNVSQALTLNETIVRGARHRKNIFENLVFVEHKAAFKTKETGAISESLDLNETLSFVKWIRPTIHETLHLSESLTRSNIYNRAISEVLPLRGGMTKTLKIGDTTYEVHEVEVVRVPKTCFVALEGTSAIVLPCPELSDTEANLNSQVLKRSMNNILYSYVRRNDLQKLSYTFLIGRPKALDLQDFVDAHIDQIITLTNWKGEIWKVKITSSPLQFTSQGRFENEGERWGVTLEFQGIKILG